MVALVKDNKVQNFALSTFNYAYKVLKTNNLSINRTIIRKNAFSVFFDTNAFGNQIEINVLRNILSARFFYSLYKNKLIIEGKKREVQCLMTDDDDIFIAFDESVSLPKEDKTSIINVFFPSKLLPGNSITITNKNIDKSILPEILLTASDIEYFNKLIGEEKATKASHTESITEIKMTNGETFFCPPETDLIFDALKHKEHTLLVGPPGCGKSTLLSLLFKMLKTNPLEVSFSSGVDESSFFGSMIATKKGNNSITEFQYGVFPTGAKEGRPIIANEIDFAQPQYLSALHSSLDEHRNTLVLLENNGEEIPIKDGFFLTATANTLGDGDDQGEYHGTRPLNAAFLDRFSNIFRLEYYADNLILDSVVKDDLFKNKISQLINDIRFLKKSEGFSYGISTRRVKMLANKIERIGFRQAFIQTIINRLPEGERNATMEVAQRLFPDEFSSIII